MRVAGSDTSRSRRSATHPTAWCRLEPRTPGNTANQAIWEDFIPIGGCEGGMALVD